MDELTQEEADRLLELAKVRTSAEQVEWPTGAKVIVLLKSNDGREEFLLDVATYLIKLSKITLQNRARTTSILVRLDIDGRPHRNPDDVEITSPHIHLFREGYNDKWAYPVPSEKFRDLSDRAKTLEDFFRFCNVVEPPHFRFGLF